jgi:Na+-driven multidrug efflux pump
MRDLTSGPEGRLVFTFAVPMLIGNLFQQRYNLVDSMVMGMTMGSSILFIAGGRWKRRALAMSTTASRRQSHG